MSRTVVQGMILILTLSTLVQVTRAQFGNPYPYTQLTLDKPIYFPGDSGTLNIDIKDTLYSNIEIYNITVVFPWRAYINGHWDGNQTIILNKSIASGSWLPTVRVSFTVPSDSRYIGGGFFGGGGQGTANIWSSGVGSGGGPGTYTTNFVVLVPYLELGLDWHTITYILIVMTVLIGIMTGAVLYYIRASLKLKRGTVTAPPPSSLSLSKEA